MQQTPNYKLNLIETSDPFSPNALNENAQKLEAALDTKTDAAGTAALDQRVQVLELRRLVAGSYEGNGYGTGDSQIIELGFTPAAVLLASIRNDKETFGLCLPEHPYPDVMEIVPGGFKVIRKSAYQNENDSANTALRHYYYIAFC